MQTQTANLNQTRERLDKEVVQAIADLLDHYTLDEIKHYSETGDGERENHILHAIATVDGWLTGRPTTAGDLVEDRRRSIPDYRPEPARGCCGDCDRGEELDRVDRETYLAGAALAGLLSDQDAGEIEYERRKGGDRVPYIAGTAIRIARHTLRAMD